MANGEQAAPGAAAPGQEQEDFDADLEAGFGGAGGALTETPRDNAQANDQGAQVDLDAAQGEVATPQPTAAPATAAPKKVEVDETELASLRQQAAGSTELNKRFDQAFGQIGSLKQLVEKLRTETPAGQSLELTEDDFKEMAEEYPEFAKVQRSALNKVLGKLKGTGSSVDVDKVVGERVTQAVAEVRAEITESSLNAVLPRWRDKVKLPAFGEWLTGQPADVKALADSKEVADAAEMLRLFRRHLETPAAKAPAATPAPTPAPQNAQGGATRQRRIAAAVMPRGDGSASASPAAEDDFEAGFRSG